MTHNPQANDIYRHFKGNLYRVIAQARHTETGEMLVIYQALYGDYQIYARPLSMFCSQVDHEKYPQVQQKDRFELIPTIVPTPRSIQPAVEPGAATAESDAATATVEPGAATAETNTATAESDAMAEPQLSSAEYTEEEMKLDPLVLEFLDADTCRKKLNILAALQPRITNEMINTLAVSMDVEVEGEDVEERVLSLRTCLLTKEKYECSRLR